MKPNRFRFRAWHKTRNKFLSDPISFYITEPSGVVNVIYSRNRVIVPAHRVVLMQSTGLKDRNDVEIFEGDILSDGRVVQFEYGRCCMYLNPHFGVELDDPIQDEIMAGAACRYEIIGNIYQNPELMKGV